MENARFRCHVKNRIFMFVSATYTYRRRSPTGLSSAGRLSRSDELTDTLNRARR